MLSEAMLMLGKQKNFKPKGAPGVDSDPETEEEVFEEKGEITAKKAGLFHKEGVSPRAYNLAESVQKEMVLMQGKALQTEEEVFDQNIEVMKKNKCFQEFMLQHQNAIINGLSKLDND